jgi:hypothetical protein
MRFRTKSIDEEIQKVIIVDKFSSQLHSKTLTLYYIKTYFSIVLADKF